MAIITPRHAQDMVIDRAIPRIVDAVASQLEIQRRVSQSGAPPLNSGNGFYDDEGVWQNFLRLDIDSMESGRGCAA